MRVVHKGARFSCLFLHRRPAERLIEGLDAAIAAKERSGGGVDGGDVYFGYINSWVQPMAALLKKPIQVYLRPEQLGALRWLARKRHVSVAELVRQGVDRVLADIPPEEDPLWDLVGMFDSGLGDLAEKHDEYIVKWIREENQ